ncbi:hypothetical protein ACP4OV_004240 [Aristida adscensionis]
MKGSFCFRRGRVAKRMSERAPVADGCVFCEIARRAPTSTTALLYSDDKVVAFKDINPSAFRFLVSDGFMIPLIPLQLSSQLPYEFGHSLDLGYQELHYLVIPIEHIPTVKSLQRTEDDHQLVDHMVKVGKDLLTRDAPNSSEHRFGFHQPPFNSVDHLHLHCLALPFMPSWRQVKYTPLGPLGGFIEAEKILERIKPQSEVYS